MKKKLKIFVCPLEWGIGHATRCVPIINELRDSGHEIVLGADGRARDFLQGHYPNLQMIRFPGFRVSYPANSSMVRHMMISVPKLIRSIHRENRVLQDLIRENSFDLVISDNRFGLHTKLIPCIYMTHQVMVKMPGRIKWLEPLIYRWHRKIIKKYDECWIPDQGGKENLSGDLAHKYPTPRNAIFIGPKSRFPVSGKTESTLIRFAATAIISGPEPQRTLLEKKLTSLLLDTGKPTIIFRGIPGGSDKPTSLGNLKIYDHADDQTIMETLNSSDRVIARAGYSTIMDLVMLKKNAILVPTPGQTEQEYLARYLSSQGYFQELQQEDIDNFDILSGSINFRPLPEYSGENFLKERINHYNIDD